MESGGCCLYCELWGNRLDLVMTVVYIEDGSRQVVRPTVGFGMLTCVFFLLKCCVSAEHAMASVPAHRCSEPAADP